jgi:hypothetical protein
VISIAVAGSARRCFTGHTIREKFDDRDLLRTQESRKIILKFKPPVSDLQVGVFHAALPSTLAIPSSVPAFLRAVYEIQAPEV